MEKSLIYRFPRGLGVTTLAQEACSGNDESFINLTRWCIQQWIINNGSLWGKHYSVQTLAEFLKCETALINHQMKQTFLENGLFSRDKVDQMADSLLGTAIAWAMEERMEINEQVDMLRKAQGGGYKPFITPEMNKALGLKQSSSTSLQSLIRTISGGGTVNIFNQHNTQINQQSEGISREEAIRIIQSENDQVASVTTKEINYIEEKYDFLELPTVVATKQDASRGDKEGLTLKNHEIESVTGDYHGAIEAFEDDHHAIRREIEENIDMDAEDPEILIL